LFEIVEDLLYLVVEKTVGIEVCQCGDNDLEVLQNLLIE